MPRDVAVNSQHHRWMIVSHPGAGKTVLAASAPDTLIVRSPSDQVDSIFTMGLESNVQEELVRHWDEMVGVFDYLRHEKHSFKWVWLDCYSLIQDDLLQSVLDDVVKGKPHRDPFVPDKGEYLRNMNRFKVWTRDMAALPINLGITAHPLRVEDPDDDSVLYYPWIQGKNMPQTIAGYMKLVAFLKVVEDDEGQEQRVLITATRGQYYAKDQYGAFNGKVINPTVPKMEDTIKKAQQSQKGATKKATTRKRTTTTKKTATRRKK